MMGDYKIKMNIDIEDIITISDYYEADRYPGPRYNLPTREEVEHYFQFAQQLFKKIKDQLPKGQKGGGVVDEVVEFGSEFFAFILKKIVYLKQLDFVKRLTMKTLNIAISDLEFNKFGLRSDSLSFSDFIDIVSRELSIQRLKESLKLAEKFGLSEITMDEISKEYWTEYMTK